MGDGVPLLLVFPALALSLTLSAAHAQRPLSGRQGRVEGKVEVESG